jgi:hypothetical protein
MSQTAATVEATSHVIHGNPAMPKKEKDGITSKALKVLQALSGAVGQHAI